MTMYELAKAWGVDVQQVKRYIKAGRLDQWITYHQVGERRYIEIDPEAINHRPKDRRKKDTDEVG